MVPQTVCGLLFCWMLVLFGGQVDAGLYHTPNSGSCKDCHKAGISGQSPLSISTLTSPTLPQNSFAPTNVNQTCLECHSGPSGSSTCPSVLRDPSGTLIREAGFLQRSGGLEHTGHTLGSMERAPGGTWTPGPSGLQCTDCHDPHGQTAQYRNLVLRPGTAMEDRPVTFVIGPTNDLGKDVWIHADPSLVEKYDTRTIWFNQPRSSRSAYGEWCQGCHTDFYGTAGAPNVGGVTGWKRHPAAGARIGGGPRYRSSLTRYVGLTNRVPTMSPSGMWPASDNTPSCMSCHKAHGNDNPFGLLFMSGHGNLTEGGDSLGKTPVDLCHQCHIQGLVLNH